MLLYKMDTIFKKAQKFFFIKNSFFLINEGDG